MGREKHFPAINELLFVSISVDPTDAMLSLARLAAESFKSDESGGVSEEHVVNHYNGHYVLKRLIANDSKRIGAGQTGPQIYTAVHTVLQKIRHIILVWE